MGDVEIRPARAEDLDAVRRLVAAAGLPVEELEQQFPGAYVVVDQGESVIGSAGLELHADAGLLRSVAVSHARRGDGIGRALIENRLAMARSRRIHRVYLLTTTAPDFFASLGFERVARETAPDALQRSSEFASVCPASAICMLKRLG